MSTKPSDDRAIFRRYVNALFILRAHHAEPDLAAWAGTFVRQLTESGSGAHEELVDLIDAHPDELDYFGLRLRALASRLTPPQP